MSIDADFTYIDGLEVANPTTGDPRSEGDDHIRGIKNAVKGTFPNIVAAAVTATAAELNYCAVTAGQVANDKAMVPTGSALDCNSIAFTEVNIDTGNIAAAVVLADGIAATTQSPSDDSVALATTAYVDAQTDADIALMKVTSTARTTYAATNAWTHAHGKASIPALVIGYAIKNATGGTDGGYSNGDKIMLNTMQDGTTEWGLQVYANATNLGASVGTNGLKAQSITGSNFTLATSEWNIYIEGVWFS